MTIPSRAKNWQKTFNQRASAKILPQGPPPEHKSCEIFYKIKTTYEITINPELQQLDEIHRLKSVYKDMKALFILYFNKDTQYILHTEISEPKFSNQTGSYPRVHFHGTIRFDTHEALGDFLLNKFHRLKEHHSIQLNEFRPEHWPLYCKKQKQLILPLLKSYKLKYLIKNK